MGTTRPIELVATLDSKNVKTGVQDMTRQLQDVPDAASKASSEMRNLSESTDETATRTGIMASALGAFAGGLEAVGLDKYAVALQGSSVAVDVFSNASDVATLALESKYVKLVRDKAATVASTAAGLAHAAATKAAAAAQWLLNAAMTANPIGLIVVGVAALVAGLVLAYKKSEDFRKVVDGLGGAFITAAKGIKTAAGFVIDFGEKVADVTGKISDKVPGASFAISGLAAAIPGGTVALAAFGLAADDASKKVEKAGGVIVDFTYAMKEQEPIEDFATAQNRLAQEAEGAQNAIDGQKRSLENYIDALTEASGQVLDLSKQQINVAQATADATAAVKENGKNHDINTEKGRNNQKALVALAEAQNQQTKAMLQNGKSQDETRAKAEATRKNFVKLAQQMGYSKSQAEAMSRSMIAIPNVSRTATLKGDIKDIDNKIAAAKRHLADKKLTEPEKAKIRADITDLYRKRYLAQQELAKIDSKTIYIDVVYTANGVPVNVPSGIGRRAAGGPTEKDKMYLVGENGPELWSESRSGYITPNNKLGSGTRGTSGGPAVIINGGTFIGSTKAEVARWMEEILIERFRFSGNGRFKEALAR